MTWIQSKLSHLMLVISFIQCKLGGVDCQIFQNAKLVECDDYQTGYTTSGSPATWFYLILQKKHYVTVSTCSSNYDTQIWLKRKIMYVWPPLANIGSCDDGDVYSNDTLTRSSKCTKCNCLQQEGDFEYACNEHWTNIFLTADTYYIKIGGFNGETGYYQFTVTCTAITPSPTSLQRIYPGDEGDEVSSEDGNRANAEDEDTANSNINENFSLYIIFGVVAVVIGCSIAIIAVIISNRKKNNTSDTSTDTDTLESGDNNQTKHSANSKTTDLPNKYVVVPQQNPKMNIQKINQVHVNDDSTIVVVLPQQNIGTINEVNDDDDPTCLYVSAGFSFLLPVVGFIMMCVYGCGKNLPPQQAKAYKIMCSCTALGFVVGCIVSMITQ